MAKKNVTTTEGKTLAQIMAEIRETVDTHNAAESFNERVTLSVKAMKLKDDYNKQSLLDTYAECLKAENPMLACIQKYQYPTINVGTKKDTGDLSIKDDCTGLINLWDFVEFCEGRNRQVAVALDWKSKAKEAHEVLLKVVKKYVEDGTEMDVGTLKTAMQAMFNSIVRVPGKDGNNAVIAKSKAVRELIMTCGKMDVKSFQNQYGAGKSWQKQVFALLHCAVEGKVFNNIYGDPEKPTANAAEAEAEAEATTEETAAE